ncbi:MAG: hypothetical protein KDK70_18920 [Myxococcales bacterium]|nr:hypothetical protein [Myxococcales bacterium]
MLFARPTRYFARAFVDGARLAPTATNFRLVSEALDDDRMLPVHATEVRPAGGLSRMAFMDTTGFQVVVSAESIYAHFIPASGTQEAFVTRATTVLERLLPLLPHRATRIAFILEGEVSTPAPDDVVRTLFRLPPLFDHQGPFEWDWRCATKSSRRFGEQVEETNTVATFRRFAGKLSSGDPFDGIIAELDINTVPENVMPRFQAADCRAFFEAGIAWHDELARELATFIGQEVPS